MIDRVDERVGGLIRVIERAGHAALIVALDRVHIPGFGADGQILLVAEDVGLGIVLVDLDFHAHAQPLGRGGVIVQAVDGRLPAEGVVGLHAGHIEAQFLPVGEAAGLIVRNPHQLVAERMQIIARIADELGFVRVGEGNRFLEPVEAVQLQILVVPLLEQADLLVDDPLDGLLAVLDFGEVLHHAVAVDVAERGRLGESVEDGEEHADRIVVQPQFLLHLPDGRVERVDVAVGGELVLNIELPAVQALGIVGVIECGIGQVEERIEEGVGQLAFPVEIADVRQIFFHRDAAALQIVGQAVVGQKHIVHAEEIVGRDVLIGVDGILGLVGDDVGGVVGDLLGAVNRQLVAVDVRGDGELKLDIARLIGLVERLGQLDAGSAFQRLEVGGGVDGLPVDAVLAGLDNQTAGQVDARGRLEQEAAHKRADRALLAQVVDDRPAQPVGEAEVRRVRIGRFRGKLAVGQHRRVLFGVIECGRYLRAERRKLLDLLRQAGDEVELLRIVALGGVPVFRLCDLGDIGIAVVIADLAGGRPVAVGAGPVSDRRHLVDKQPDVGGRADFVPNVARRDGAGQTQGERVRLGARHLRRRKHGADPAKILTVGRDRHGDCGGQADAVIPFLERADLEIGQPVHDLAEVEGQRHRLAAVEAHPGLGVKNLRADAVGQRPAAVAGIVRAGGAGERGQQTRKRVVRLQAAVGRRAVQRVNAIAHLVDLRLDERLG